MRHDPNNSQCDKNQYGDAPDIRCTCDVDDPADAPVPSTVVGAAQQIAMPRHRTALEVTQFGEVAGQVYGNSQAIPGVVTLTGRAAASHHELRAAGVELKAAQDLYRRAEQRYRAALDAHMQELLA